jgi:hypothetical protein
LLEDEGVSFAVIQNNALADNKKNGDLGNEAYERKSLLKSVAPPGTLGALLDGRKKPGPVIKTNWFQSDTQISILATVLAHAVLEGKEASFTATLDKLLPQLHGVTLNLDSIQVADGEVIFSVRATDNNGKLQEIWIRARADTASTSQLLEDRLFIGLSRVHSKPAPSEIEEPIPTTQVFAITPNVSAFASTSKTEAFQTRIKSSG